MRRFLLVQFHRLSLLTMIAFIATPAIADTNVVQPAPRGAPGRYQLVAKANGLDFAIMIDTETGTTWRLAFIPSDPKDPTKGLWKWTPIENCPDCR
jgi:hypothetical protein